jgi:PAS domain S-box-containing protein
MVWLKDRNNRILRCNRLAAESAGRTVADMESQQTSEFYPEEADKYWKDDLEVIESGGPKLGIIERYQISGGQKIWIRTDKIPYRDESGAIIGVLVFAIDISALKHAEEERDELLTRERRARSQAEAANLLKEEFLSTLSHELRTPMTAVLGYAGLLSDAKLDENARTRAVASIERNARAQVRLIEDLLDASAIMSARMRIVPCPIDLVRVIQGALDAVRPAADAKSISIELSLGDCAVTLMADPVRLQQVFWNLLSNAIKFTPPKGKITVSIQQTEKTIEVSVKDTGQGIDPAFLPFVFERFRQADSSATRQHRGLGLGLAIARHLAELHGGRVRAESPGVGQGSTFHVELPIVTRDGRAALPEANGMRDLEPLQPLLGIRVLSVDDDGDTCSFVRMALEKAGAQVEIAMSAREARELLKRASFDVLISDIAMPDEDGLELLRQIDRPILAIALSAYTSSEDVRRALAAGYAAHLAKPISIARLTSEVASRLSAIGKSPR